MYRLTNPVRRYDWGSTSLLQEFCGLEPDGLRAAEMWMGAHPDDPSQVLVDGEPVRLDHLIARDPEPMLGAQAITAFGPRLPFLVKLLAAAHPLSIQVHPDTDQARAGYAAEQKAGISRNDARRNYHDQAHKPEILYALTPFELMTGLRPAAEAARLIDELGIDDLDPLVAALRNPDDPDPLRTAFATLLEDRGSAAPWIAKVAARAADAGKDRELRTVALLGQLFPGDPGLLAPLLLNTELLSPGEVVYTPARSLHSYVRGLGVEVMASSDNVLRAGLTSKAVDTDEVLRIASFAPAPVRHLGVHDGEVGAPVPDFALTVVRGGAEHLPGRGPRIVVCIDQNVRLAAASQTIALRRGESAFVTDAAGALTVSGPGAVAIAHL
ncbi:MAG: mannose-6-phosphate isomerase, class I [Cellulomonadaceae bacterium]